MRTPYEKEIDPIGCTPHELIKNSKYKDFFQKVTPELATFHKKIDEEKDKWYNAYNVGNLEILWHPRKKHKMNSVSWIFEK